MSKEDKELEESLLMLADCPEDTSMDFSGVCKGCKAEVAERIALINKRCAEARIALLNEIDSCMQVRPGCKACFHNNAELTRIAELKESKE